MTSGNQPTEAGGHDGRPTGPPSDVLRGLMDAGAFYVAALDIRGALKSDGAGLKDLLGLESADAVTGFNFLQALKGRDRTNLQAHLDRVIVDKQPARCEINIKLPSKKYVWLRLISRPGEDVQGNPLCWTYVEDITHVRRLEKTDALYQRAPDVMTKSGSVKEFSRQIFDLLRVLFGVENAYVALRDDKRDFVTFPYYTDSKDGYPAARKVADGLTDYVITTGRIFWMNDESSRTHVSDGHVKVLGSTPSDWLGVPITCKGRVVGMTAIQTYEEGVVFDAADVSLMLGVSNLFDIFLTRMDVEQEHSLLAAAVEQADETVVITDHRGVLMYVNPAFERKTGFTRKQALGHTLALISSGRQDKAYIKHMWEDISSGKIWRGRFTNRKKDGTLFDEDVVISPVKNRDGDIVNYVGVKRDVSHEKEVARGAASSRKIDVIQKLVESINHDFSNLLMTIQANAEDVKKHLTRDAAAKEIDQIISSAGRGEELVQTLSFLFEHERDVTGTVQLNECLIHFERIARRLVDDKYTVQLELAPRMEPVRVNWSEVEQVLFSLIHRAAAAMPEGGQIAVRTLVVPARKEDVYLFVDESPSGLRKCAVIEVADQGPIIPRKDWETLFDADDAADGMGSVRELVARQKGYIALKENVPSGMVFRLYVPVVSGDAHQPVALGEPEAALPRGNETILIAEDDDGARRVMARMLESHGYTVLEAENGAMAVRYLLSHSDGIDLLLTDMMMPDFDGRELAEQSQGMHPGMKIVYVSGYSRAELESRGMLEAQNQIPLLKKPFKRENLLTLVRQALDS